MNDSTKEKILEVARLMFAEKGFAATSIRDIATEAEVNLASVNYHFKNKQNLFEEIIKTGFMKAQADIAALCLISKSTPEFGCALYDHFISKGPDLLTHFKMMLTKKESEILERGEDEMIGPPGGKKLLEMITQEVGEKVPLKDRIWAVRALFTYIIHMAILIAGGCAGPNQPFLSKEEIHEGITKLAKSLIRELKSA